MKVNLELDVTPEEMRRLLGLPDVSPVNDMLVERLREQVEKGLDGTLLRNMVTSIVKGGSQGLEAYQSLLNAVFNRARAQDENPSRPPGPGIDPGPPDQGANGGSGNR